MTYVRILGSAALIALVVACGAPQTAPRADTPRVTPTELGGVASTTAPSDDPAALLSPATEATPAPADAPALTRPTLTGAVVTDADVRDQPTTEGSNVLTQVGAGETVQLVMRDEGSAWYGIVDPRGGRG